MKKNIKLYVILFLLLVIVALLVFGINYAIKNRNSSEITQLKNIDAKVTIEKDQLDNIKLPSNNNKLIYSELPKINNTIDEINYNTVDKIFHSHGRSLLIIVKNDCSYCKEFMPIVEESLKELDVKAYKLNISKLSSNESSKLENYIDYTGTPTTYTIVDGNATHLLTGSVDKDTFKAFVDYFHIRKY